MYIYRRNFPAPHNTCRVQLLSLQPALAPPHLCPGPAPAEARLGHRAVDPVKVVTHILVHAQHFLIILKHFEHFVHQIIFYLEPRHIRDILFIIIRSIFQDLKWKICLLRAKNRFHITQNHQSRSYISFPSILEPPGSFKINF